MIDFQSKPVWTPSEKQPKCPFCTKWREMTKQKEEWKIDGNGQPVKVKIDIPTCFKCGKEIKETNRYAESGYQARSIHHWHARAVSGISGAQCIRETLCHECCLEDYKHPK